MAVALCPTANANTCPRRPLTTYAAKVLGGYVRGEGGNICGSGFTSSPGTIYAVGGGTTMLMVDPERQLTFVFLSCSLVEGLTHFARLRRLSDLALAACE